MGRLLSSGSGRQSVVVAVLKADAPAAVNAAVTAAATTVAAAAVTVRRSGPRGSYQQTGPVVTPAAAAAEATGVIVDIVTKSRRSLALSSAAGAAPSVYVVRSLRGSQRRGTGVRVGSVAAATVPDVDD